MSTPTAHDLVNAFRRAVAAKALHNSDENAMREQAAAQAIFDHVREAEHRGWAACRERAAAAAGEYREGDEDGVPDRIEAAIRALEPEPDA